MATYTFDKLVDFELANIALPSGYTKLNYLQSDGSGNQYIETNYTPIATTGMNLLLMATQTGLNDMGCFSGNRWGFAMNVNSTPFYHFIDTSQRLLTYNSPLNTQVNFKFNYNNDGKIYLGNSEFSFGTQNYPIGTTFWLFRLHGYNGQYFKGNIYYCEFTEESNSVQKLIPCEREADNVLGMYDVVNDTFIEGTGTFASGGDAPTYSFQDGDVVTITDVGITLTYTNGNLYFSTNESLTLSQFNSIRSICKGTDGVVVTITDLNNLQVTSNGTDWLITADTTLATLSQFNSLCSVCKGTNGVVVTITENKSYYRWQNNDWEFWYQEAVPLVFKGITFEQTDYWQIPESVFRGLSFEIVYKKGGSALWHGMV